MFRIFFLITVFLIPTKIAGQTAELTKTTSFNITPYINYNNFISHEEVFTEYTSKKVKYIPSITIGFGVNLYEKLSKNISFLHGLDFGYNIYSKKQANIINITGAKQENSGKTTEAVNSVATQDVAVLHDNIEQERREIIEANTAFVEDLYGAVLATYLGNDLPEEQWYESGYIHEGSEGFSLVERLNYSKFTIEEIADLVKKVSNGTYAIPLMAKDYDGYTSWDEAYNAYMNKDTELMWIDDEYITEENATKYAMLKTGLFEKPENYEKDPYTKYSNIKYNGSLNEEHTTATNVGINSILKTTYSFVERYYVMYRIGFNMKQTQNVSLQPFLNIGLNVGELNITKLYSTNITSTSKKFKAGFSMGIGLDMIVKERFVVGLNYRLSINKYNDVAKFYTHCFALKFGVAFL